MAAVMAATCGAIIILYALGSWWSSHQKPGKTKSSLIRQELEVELPEYSPLRSEQEVAALKEEEINLAKQLLRDFPGHVDALIHMARVYHRQGNAIESLAILHQALKASPQRAEIYLRMAEISMEKGELERTVAEYQEALRLQPRMPDALSKMANALNMLGKQEEAIAALKTAIQSSPGRSTPYFLLGQSYLQQKEYQKARESYEKAIQFQPDDAKAYYGLAQVHTRLGNRDQAQKLLERFRELKAEGRKDLISRKSRYDDRTAAQKRAALTHLEIGRMYRDQGEIHQAEELLKQAIGFDPNNVVCYMELAAIYNTMGASAKALHLFKRVREIQPDNPTSYLMMGIVSAHLNRPDEAEAAFNTLIRLAPQMSDGYRELARLYLQSRKKTPQARQLAEKALGLEANAANYFMLAWACTVLGDDAAALPAVKRALELEPENPDCQRLYRMIQQGN